MSEIGRNIKIYREAKGLTQEELAEAIGKTKNVVSNWENGRNKPDADTIEKLLNILEVDANTLFGWDDPKQLKSDAADLADKLLTDPKIKKAGFPPPTANHLSHRHPKNLSLRRTNPAMFPQIVLWIENTLATSAITGKYFPAPLKILSGQHRRDDFSPSTA